ncbi:Cyclin-dependent kinases regulatory subunit (Cell division control protein cks1) [Microbotryomycetes sp. JL221]|nr:Cyclin-dependent kinases regulatory subunit (Cell division control protein cks1) [Microbotryomycetes sp. JL221]
MAAGDKATYQDYVDRIHYSERYADDEYEYRHVILPKGMLKMIPKNYFEPGGNVLRLLTEEEWRGMGIQQSLGWETYSGTTCTGTTHRQSIKVDRSHLVPTLKFTPFMFFSEKLPLQLLFRREKDYQTKYGPQGKQK